MLPVFVWGWCFAALHGQPATTQFGDLEGWPTIAWQAAADHIGDRVIVHGKIIHAQVNSGGCVLHFDQPRSKSLQVFIRRESLSKFAQAPDEAYPGRWVRAEGIIQEFRGVPQIIVRDPSRLTVLPEAPPMPPAAATSRPVRDEFTLGAYNILNLFDTADDPYRGDEDTPFKPRPEMASVAKTIRLLDADVLALEEVENRGVLQRFVRTFLPDMGYEHVVLLEGNDDRGIDCALLSRLPVGPVTSYQHVVFPMEDGRPTRFRRDCLRVRIEPVGGAAFDVMVVHLKSKSGEDNKRPSPIRRAEARKVRDLCDQTLAADPAARFVVCGDFNDTWDSDAIKAIRGEGPRALRCFWEELPADGRNTYNRGQYRSTIDYIFCSPAMAASYVPNSYRVIPGSVETHGSDHNPISARFRLR